MNFKCLFGNHDFELESDRWIEGPKGKAYLAFYKCSKCGKFTSQNLILTSGVGVINKEGK